MKQSTRVFAAAALLLTSMSIGRAGETAAGRWEGIVQIPDREFKLVIDLAQSDGKAWIGSAIIPGLDVKGTQLADIAVQNSDVSFTIKTPRGLQATLKGNLNSDGTLAGDFVEAGNTAPFVLKKTGPAQVEMPPQSTPISKELEGEWKGEYQLYGYPRHVTVKLVNRGSEGGSAELVIVGKKTTNLPVDLVTLEGDSLTIDSHGTGISYEGRFNRDASEIKGIFIQAGTELPLVLRRVK